MQKPEVKKKECKALVWSFIAPFNGEEIRITKIIKKPEDEPLRIKHLEMKMQRILERGWMTWEGGKYPWCFHGLFHAPVKCIYCGRKGDMQSGKKPIGRKLEVDCTKPCSCLIGEVLSEEAEASKNWR